MAETATIIVLTAGTMTFANEWYQTGKVNWRVPVATVLAAGVFDGLAHLDSKAATALSVMVLIAASVTEFGGKSAISTLAGLFSQATTKQKFTPQPKKAA